jgi:UDP-3-O-[3-hydroxymyristoyl] glucosamine N-acyltransferase
MARVRLSELAKLIEATVVAEDDPWIEGIAPLHEAGPSQLSFLTNMKYRKQALESDAAALLVSDASVAANRMLVHPKPYLVLAQLLSHFYPAPPRPQGVHASAIIDPSAQIDPSASVGPLAVVDADVVLEADVWIGAGVVIGNGCRIGSASELRPNVVLYPQTQLGERCLIHSGVVLGGDGFGFASADGVHHKVPQVGRVVVEDDVEIGANSAIDRGALDDTVIGAGSKIDDLVMVAHGVQLGRGALLAAQSGIAGSSRVGDFVTFAGQAGAAGHLKIGPGTVVAAKSALLGDLEAGGFVAGIPAVDHRTWKRSQALIRRLPEMRSELTELRRRIAELEAALEKTRGSS